MKRLFAAAAAALLVAACMSGCRRESERYQTTFLTLFDTVTTVTGYAEDRADFNGAAEKIYEGLRQYNQLYDIYNEYDGINNIKTINDSAGIAPVEVDEKIIDMLEFSVRMYEATGGAVNVAMGSVLSVWHDARERGLDSPEYARLPGEAALREAARHTDISDVVIDREAGTVYLADAKMSLDVGAIAKGYAVREVCEALRGEGVEHYIVNVGGNVCAIGERADGKPWNVGVTNSLGGEDDKYICYFSVADMAVVTSGSYQRYYIVDGVRYHHIIDPKTLYPEKRYESLTVLAKDSALADALSTALFNMDEEAGRALIGEINGVEAMWVYQDGTISRSEGLDAYLKEDK